MKRLATVFCAIGMALIILACVCFGKGFDYKNNYYNSEDYPILNTNAYVGGDAYNYIINGTYFTGYMVLGGASGIGGIILLCAGFFTYLFDKQKMTDNKDIKKSDETVNNIKKQENNTGEYVKSKYDLPEL